MIWTVTYVSFYMGVVSAALVTGVVHVFDLQTPWAGINRVLPVGAADDRSVVGLGIVFLVLSALGWMFPWTINHVFGLHGCYWTQFPHTALAGIGYGLAAGIVLGGIYVVAGLVPRKNARAIGSVIGFYSAFGLVLGVFHGVINPLIQVNVGGACPPLF